MTQPANSIKRGGSRFYVDPVTGDKLPSVTSVQNALAKPALEYWAAKMVAQCAVEEFGTGLDDGSGNPENAIDYLKRAPGRSSGKASTLGSEIHDLADRIGKAKPRTSTSRPPGIHRPAPQVHRRLRVGFLESEATVWSDTYGFAGTLDIS